MGDAEGKCRLDKWLWAARFFKTRSLATDAIDGGKIHVDGDRAKPAKEVRLGQVIHIRRKELDMEVTVRGLSTQRKGAPEAALLFEETPESMARRENLAVTREADHGRRDRGMGRPTKRQRRDIKKFTGIDW
ncbi:RNA-binding protein [Methylobacillus caricis]|uniref:RNA-binding S4 domain-containing protein n=1 Tax=Methylobacillus caricis TaxID=1971611 RepID=UPI001D000410|nr:S4 domain-containing protein [Methylobacillus caricis]MCB5187707.1 RNA-binding protein [Methylobacillus caricis]